MIVLSCFVPKHESHIVDSNMLLKTSNSVNVFQWNLLEGLEENGIDNAKIFNALPVGTWPLQYEKAVLRSKSSSIRIGKYNESITINLPVLKQISRYLAAVSFLRKNPDKQVLVYSAYLPFLAAATRRSLQKEVTLLVTDLPQHYDFDSVISPVRRFARKLISFLTYRCIRRVDKFVILTETMHAALSVGDRPYIVLEGMVPTHSSPEIVVTGDDAELPQNGNAGDVILYSGALASKYGISNLLDAFKEIPAHNIQLWICGGGEAEEEVRQAACDDGRIKYLGFLSPVEVQKLQSLATVLVNPRLPENEFTKYSFPSKTTEYMLSGKPVVMYKLEGIPDEYDEFLYYVNQNETLAECLQRVLSIPKLQREENGKRARSFIQSQKNSMIQTKRILQLLHNKTQD